VGAAEHVDGVELDHPDLLYDPAEMPDIDTSLGSWVGEALGGEGEPPRLIVGDLPHLH
jgi:hypothetical protein